MSDNDTQNPRVLVIGAGIGGLTTAALLAQAGHAVTVLEANSYPGGSAGTYYRQGYRFDSGATLAGGFQPGGPHTLLADRLGIVWPVRSADPAWVVHLPDARVTLARDNADMLRQFPESRAFWSEQARIADQVWALSARGLPWPPGGLVEGIQLARVGLGSLPGSMCLLRYAFQSARQWAQRHHLTNNAAFMRLLDAQLLISAQTTSAYANALYSATALDLPRQGVRDVESGIGGLARVLVDAIQALGGHVLYKQEVTRIAVNGGRVTGVYARRKHRNETYYPCEFLIANMTPWSLDGLLGEASPVRLRREVQRRDLGWGAFVLYLGVVRDRLPRDLPDHHQIITSMDGPLGEGRSIFVSLSPRWDTSRAPEGHSAVTVTTHTAVQPWWDALAHSKAAYEDRKGQYTDQMLDAIDRVIPGFRGSVMLTMDGSPVTYQNWTHRHLGMVGGFPQTSLFKARGPRTGIPNLRLVGDSIFPGQSTAGVTVGAMRVAEDVVRSLPQRSTRRIFEPQITG